MLIKIFQMNRNKNIEGWWHPVTLAVLLLCLGLMSQSAFAQAPRFAGTDWDTFSYTKDGTELTGAEYVCDDDDIDQDNDGLVEVCFLEDLNAVRYALDGSGLQTTSGATKTTLGCKSDGCNGYELVRDLDFQSDDSYRTTANKMRWATTASGGWLPIGDGGSDFSGIFDGNAYTLSNLKIDRPDTDSIGLFSFVSETIKSIGLLNVMVHGYDFVGGLVGENQGMVIDSYSTGRVSGNDSVGGLVGDNIEGTISDSYSGGRISAAAERASVGGLVGNNDEGMVHNSYSTGRVEAAGDDASAGGLVGDNFGEIINSYSAGQVEASNSDSEVGGLVGNNEGSVINSYSSGQVTGNGNVGGLVGYNALEMAIRNSYSSGQVTGSGNVGGLVGNNEGLIISSYSTGQVEAVGDDASVGGLVGEDSDGSVMNSYWDTETSIQLISAGGTSKTTAELRAPTAPGQTTGDIYYRWSTDDWDFGTSDEYPAIRVNGGGCRSLTSTNSQTLICESLLDGQRASDRFYRLDETKTISLDANRIAGLSGTSLTYLWQQLSGPTVDFTTNTRMLEIATTQSLVGKTLVFSLTVNEQRFSVPAIRLLGDKPVVAALAPLSITEGLSVTVDATDKVSGPDGALSYAWRVLMGDKLPSLLASQATNATTLTLTVPTDWVVDAEDKQTTVTLQFTISDAAAQVTTTLSVVIVKANNGSLTRAAAPMRNGMTLTAALLDLANDPDSTVETPGSIISYQWQQCTGVDCSSTSSWSNVSREEETASFTVPTRLATMDSQFRVIIKYKDGQGYDEELTSQALNYRTAPVLTGTEWSEFSYTTNGMTFVGAKYVCADDDIDNDNDGLIELCYLEGLDAVRWQLDGSGLQTTQGATEITRGCKSDGCNGYELVRDLDFQSDDSYRSSATNKAKWETTASGGWLPIENGDSDFSGIFDGNAYTLSNLKIDRPDASSVGLFSSVSGTIKSIGLRDIAVHGDEDIGGLVGLNKGTIMDSYSTGQVSGSDYVGGLVGYNEAGIVSSSYNTGQVEATGEIAFVGGLVGYNEGETTVSNSYNTGPVKATGLDPSVGGLVGHNFGDITNSYSTGQVEATGDDADAGGLVGNNEATIINSYSTGQVKAAGGDADVGGLVGLNDGGTIVNSYSTGQVEATGDDAFVGGLVGEDSDGSVMNSYWDTETSIQLISAGGTSKTTAELRAPTAPGQTTGDIYYRWSTDDWDFGTSDEYPAIRVNGGGCRSFAASVRVYTVGKTISLGETISLDADRISGMNSPALICGSLLAGQRPSATSVTYSWQQLSGLHALDSVTTNTRILVIPISERLVGETLVFSLTVNGRQFPVPAIRIAEIADALRVRIKIFLEGALR